MIMGLCAQLQKSKGWIPGQTYLHDGRVHLLLSGGNIFGHRFVAVVGIAQ